MTCDFRQIGQNSSNFEIVSNFDENLNYQIFQNFEANFTFCLNFLILVTDPVRFAFKTIFPNFGGHFAKL